MATVTTLVTDTDRVRAILEAGRNPSPQTGGIPDASINVFVEPLEELVGDYLRRTLLSAERTKQVGRVRRGTRVLHLSGYPVDPDADFEVRQALDRDFTDDSTIVDTTDYWVDRETGVVYFDVPLIGGAGTVQVTYTGGMAENLAGMVAAFPGVVTGATLWAADLYRRAQSLSLSGESARGAGSKSYLNDREPPTKVRGLIDPHSSVGARADL